MPAQTWEFSSVLEYLLYKWLDHPRQHCGGDLCTLGTSKETLVAVILNHIKVLYTFKNEFIYTHKVLDTSEAKDVLAFFIV
jgi:hypothetical protein